LRINVQANERKFLQPLRKHTPLTSQTSCGFKTTHLQDFPCCTEWIDVIYKPLGCIFLTIWIRFVTAHAIKNIDF